ncbi:hypothetical protein EVAR_36634_1 [Eumeta japonica]|uniref:Uncharacterized protein n=1 Tax=Eumeta variegata TaxID=151549 RepID=A0A4C1YKR1_EUMVA|nr:hypothetical protein EVAR_36634_1 [Eumeta japonica]
MEPLRETPCALELKDRFAGLFICSHCFLGVRKTLSWRLYHEPHSTDVVFGRRRRRMFLTQTVSQISATSSFPSFPPRQLLDVRLPFKFPQSVYDPGPPVIGLSVHPVGGCPGPPRAATCSSWSPI